jgi:hypothetical protein
VRVCVRASVRVPSQLALRILCDQAVNAHALRAPTPLNDEVHPATRYSGTNWDNDRTELGLYILVHT